jgi:hypothetical protein
MNQICDGYQNLAYDDGSKHYLTIGVYRWNSDLLYYSCQNFLDILMNSCCKEILVLD